jgi:hypothetical protein
MPALVSLMLMPSYAKKLFVDLHLSSFSPLLEVAVTGWNGLDCLIGGSGCLVWVDGMDWFVWLALIVVLYSRYMIG